MATATVHTPHIPCWTPPSPNSLAQSDIQYNLHKSGTASAARKEGIKAAESWALPCRPQDRRAATLSTNSSLGSLAARWHSYPTVRLLRDVCTQKRCWWKLNTAWGNTLPTSRKCCCNIKLCIPRALASTKEKCPRELNGAIRTWQLVSAPVGYAGSTPGPQPSPLRNIYLFYATHSGWGGNTKMLVPLLNLQVFVIFCFWRRSNPFSPRMNASSTVQPNSLFPGVKDSSSRTPLQPRFAVRQAQLLS